MLVLSVEKHVEIFNVLHLSLDLEYLGERRHHLYCNNHASFLVEKTLDNLAQAVTCAVLGGDSFNVDSPCFKPLMIFVLRHLKMVLLVCALSFPARGLNGIDCKKSVDEDHEYVIGANKLTVELLIVESSSIKEDVEPPALFPALLMHLIVEYKREHHGEASEVQGQLEKAPLEKQVEITVCASVQHPVLHIQLIKQRVEHLPKYFECLCLREKSTLRNFSDVAIGIDGHLS